VAVSGVKGFAPTVLVNGATVSPTIGDNHFFPSLLVAAASGPGTFSGKDIITIRDVGPNPLSPVQRTYQITAAADGSWALSSKVVLGERGPGKTRFLSVSTAALVTDAELVINCSAAPRTVTLPLFANIENGHRLTVKKGDPSLNALTVTVGVAPLELAAVVESVDSIPIAFAASTSWMDADSITFVADVVGLRWIIV
jgi:hypothetical protein